MTIFSGDIFSPSPISYSQKGRNMLSTLELSNIDFMTYGNHDFDFGIDNLETLKKDIKAKVILSNLQLKSDNGSYQICDSLH